MSQPPVKVAGVILAAGLARRFGAEKLRADLAGRPLGRWAVEAALASFLEPLILVIRPGLEDLAPAKSRLTVVVNPAPAAGQAGSLRLGLAKLSPEISHALVLLADMPLVSAGLINRFVDLAQAGTRLAALKAGAGFTPPALLGREFFPEMMSLAGDQGGRGVVEKYLAQAVLLDDETAGLDVDRPQDLAEATRRLTWCD